MIIYATAKTMKLYHLMPPEKLSPANAPLAKSVLARDSGDALREWGLNCFVFSGKNCIAAVNRATKFTLFLFDVKEDHMENFGNILAHYLLELYTGDKEMTQCLHRMFADDKFVIFAPLKDRSLIASVNHMITDYALYGERFYGYIDYRNILHTRQINYDVNFNYPVKLIIDGETTYLEAGPYFRELMIARYGGK